MPKRHSTKRRVASKTRQKRRSATKPKTKSRRRSGTKTKTRRRVASKPRAKPRAKPKRGGAGELDKTIAQRIVEMDVAGSDREALMTLCDTFFKGTDYEEQYQKMKNRTDKPRSVAEYEAINLCKNAALAISGQKMSPVRRTPEIELPKVKWYRRLPSPKKLRKIVDYFKPKPKSKPGKKEKARFSDDIPTREYLAKMRAPTVKIMEPEEYQMMIHRTVSDFDRYDIPPPPPPLPQRPRGSEQQPERLPSGYENISQQQYAELMRLIRDFEISSVPARSIPPRVQRTLASVPARPEHTLTRNVRKRRRN
jgi:hypothetical protein